MNFDNVIIVSDMDGTFLGKGASTIPRNLESIESFKLSGGHFTFATGRIKCNILKAVPNCQEVCNAPVISSNGSCIFDFDSKRPLFTKPMNTEDAVRAVNYAQSHYPSVGVRCSTEYGLLVTSLDNEYIKRDAENFTGFEGDVIKTKSTELWNDEKILKLVFRGDEEQLIALRRELEEILGNLICTTTSSRRFLEINAPGCSKALGVRFLKDWYLRKYQREPYVICVGDYENDIEMLHEADCSFCPSNASDEVKAEVFRVLCDNNDGVIADIVDLITLI